MMEPEVGHGATKVYPRVKLEAVKLIKERGVGYVQAARDLGVHQSVLRQLGEGLRSRSAAFLSRLWQMKPEQLEIARLKREVTRLKAERDILKKPRPTSGVDVKFTFIAKHRGSGRRNGCAGRSVSRGVASMLG
jgi:transposase